MRGKDSLSFSRTSGAPGFGMGLSSRFRNKGSPVSSRTQMGSTSQNEDDTGQRPSTRRHPSSTDSLHLPTTARRPTRPTTGRNRRPITSGRSDQGPTSTTGPTTSISPGQSIASSSATATTSSAKRRIALKSNRTAESSSPETLSPTKRQSTAPKTSSSKSLPVLPSQTPSQREKGKTKENGAGLRKEINKDQGRRRRNSTCELNVRTTSSTDHVCARARSVDGAAWSK
jgi:hypothetical protein